MAKWKGFVSGLESGVVGSLWSSYLMENLSANKCVELYQHGYLYVNFKFAALFVYSRGLCSLKFHFFDYTCFSKSLSNF